MVASTEKFTQIMTPLQIFCFQRLQVLVKIVQPSMGTA